MLGGALHSLQSNFHRFFQNYQQFPPNLELKLVISQTQPTPHIACGCYIGLFFMFSNIYPLRFPQQNLCCISNSTLKRPSKSYWNRNVANLVTIIKKRTICWLLDWIQTSSLLCSLLSVEQLVMFEDVVQTCVFLAFAIWSSLDHVPINHRGLIKVDEANADTFSIVDSSNQWIRTL